MTRTVLENGKIRLTSTVGIIDKRTNAKHHDVICSEKNERYFEEVVVETPKKKTRTKKS